MRSSSTPLVSGEFRSLALGLGACFATGQQVNGHDVTRTHTPVMGRGLSLFRVVQKVPYSRFSQGKARIVVQGSPGQSDAVRDEPRQLKLRRKHAEIQPLLRPRGRG